MANLIHKSLKEESTVWVKRNDTRERRIRQRKERVDQECQQLVKDAPQPMDIKDEIREFARLLTEEKEKDVLLQREVSGKKGCTVMLQEEDMQQRVARNVLTLEEIQRSVECVKRLKEEIAKVSQENFDMSSCMYAYHRELNT